MSNQHEKMSAELTHSQKNAIWEKARSCGLFTIKQGTQRFDDALFRFAASMGATAPAQIDPMAVAEAVRDACYDACGYNCRSIRELDLTAIVEAGRPANTPEPVNQRLLSVAQSILAPDMIDMLPAEYVAQVRAAIAAAEAAQPGRTIKPVTFDDADELARQYSTATQPDEYHFTKAQFACFVQCLCNAADGSIPLRQQQIGMQQVAGNGRGVADDDLSVLLAENQWKCKSCGCDAGISGEPYWTHGSTQHAAEAIWRCDRCDATHVVKLFEPTAPARSVPDGWRALLSEIAKYAPEGISAPTALQGFAILAAQLLATAPKPEGGAA